MRMSAPQIGRDFQLGEWRVQPSLLQVAGPPGSFRLEPKALEVLVHLAQRPDHIVTKDELLDLVWKDTFVADGALFRQVSELRRVLGDDSREPRYIQTIPKKGYRLVAPLSYDVTGPTTGGGGQDALAPASSAEKPALRPVLPLPVAAIPPPARHRGRGLLWAALPLLVVLAFLTCASSQGARVASAKPTLAVPRLDNSSGDLSSDLVGQVAERAGVESVFVGSFVKAGDTIRINARRQDASSGFVR